jgi:arsenite methyltransferase
VVQKIIKNIPAEVREKFYGCGAPLPLGIEGLRVLDLGSGSGRDCYAAAAMVGEKGAVTGIDMTAEQLKVAREHAARYCTETLGYAKPNMEFIEGGSGHKCALFISMLTFSLRGYAGYIERLEEAGVKAESFDIAISNCVVNLSPDKPAVLKQVYRCRHGMALPDRSHSTQTCAARRRFPRSVHACMARPTRFTRPG